MIRIVLAAVLAASLAAPASAQMWAGAYDCPGGQGPTAMTLRIEQRQGDAVVAAVAFFALAENPRVPTGCYRVVGDMVKGDGGVRLAPLEWVDRPAGYVMTGFSGRWDEETGAVTGAIDHPSCAGFQLQPVSPDESYYPSCNLAISSRPGAPATRTAALDNPTAAE